MSACHDDDGDAALDQKQNNDLKRAIRDARRAMIPESYIQRVVQFAEQGFKQIEFRTFDTDWESEAYRTVSGQNSNNSVRVTNAFIEAVEKRRRLDTLPPRRRRTCKDSQGQRSLGPDCARGLGVGRSRRSISYHDQ